MEFQFAPQQRTQLRRMLLAWYRRNARDLPWRKTNDPYQIWVSEVMLQQTQVETVKPYFQRFLKTFPNVQRLAAAPESKVLRLWEGLGYYRRARQLHQAAQVICHEHDGVFPVRIDQVQLLPGIGRYTAGAVLSMAHDQRQPILEANTIRLDSRLIGYPGDPTRSAGQKVLWQFAKDILPVRGSGRVNQALMELGSQVCYPIDPACHVCPLTSVCRAFALGAQDTIPLAKKKIAFESVTEIAVVIRHRGKVLLRKCGEGERWSGLWDYPRFSWTGLANGAATQTAEPSSTVIQQQVQALTGVTVACGPRLLTIKHGVTKYRITLHCYEAAPTQTRAPKAKPPAQWVPLSEIESYPFSTTGRKIGRLLGKKENRSDS